MGVKETLAGARDRLTERRSSENAQQAVNDGPVAGLYRFADPLIVFAVTRGVLALLVYAGAVLLPRSQGTQPGSSLLAFLTDPWRRWDAGWYLSIVEQGYWVDPATNIGSVAFFPLYPLLVRGLNLLAGHPVVAGILVSNVCLALAMCLLYDLVADKFDRHVAWRAVLLLSVYPYSFFFSAIYSESLFLLTAVLAFWLAERGRWWPAGVAGMLCSLTRQVGVVLLPALGLLYLRQRRYDLRRIGPEVMALGLVPLGIAVYMAFLYWRFDDPLAFYRATVFGWKHYNLWVHGISRMNPLSFRVGSYDLVLALSLYMAIIWLAASIPLSRLLGPAYSVFVALATIIPLSVGLESLGRYISVAFPVYILAAYHVRSPLAFNLLTAFSALWLALLAVLYANGFWIV